MENSRSIMRQDSYDRSRLIMSYGKDKLNLLREMWDIIFCDPESFTDYYFNTVCSKESGNKILTAYYDACPIGMVHLNPYIVNICGSEEKCYYIVGVCVREDMRHRGIMRAMIERVLGDMKKEGCKFTFLMPKRQEYYLSFGFEMVYWNKVLEYRLDKAEVSERRYPLIYCKELSEVKDSLLSDFDDKSLNEISYELNRSLYERYRMFSVRNREYLRSMCEEHLCQNGNVIVVHSVGDDKTTEGVYSYDIYEDTMYVERLYCRTGNTRLILAHALKKAYDSCCSKCIITVPQAGLTSKDYLFEGLTVEVSDGKGIMVKVLDEESGICINDIKNRCFFDEII